MGSGASCQRRRTPLSRRIVHAPLRSPQDPDRRRLADDRRAALSRRSGRLAVDVSVVGSRRAGQPRPEQALVAGRTATLAWSAGPRLASSRRIEEWEAFLSVDGGAHYVVRAPPTSSISIAGN